MKKKLSKKEDWRRRGRSFYRHLLLMMVPFLIAAAAAMIWDRLRERGWVFDKEDEVILTTVILTIGMAYGIAATLVMNTVWGKYRKVMLSVLEKDERTFLKYRDDRMPIVLHLFLASLSLPLISMIMAFPFRGEWSGRISIFFIAFILSLYWVALAQLEDPARSAWLAERVPEEWLKEDVDKFFGFEGEEKKESRLLRSV